MQTYAVIPLGDDNCATVGVSEAASEQLALC